MAISRHSLRRSPRQLAASQQRETTIKNWVLRGPRVGEMTSWSRSDKPHYANTFSKSPSEDYSPWPISSGELASRIDLGISDDRIAELFRC